MSSWNGHDELIDNWSSYHLIRDEDECSSKQEAFDYFGEGSKVTNQPVVSRI